MGCFGSKPAVLDSHYPATQQQPIYTTNNPNNALPGNNVYSASPAYNIGQEQLTQPNGAPTATGVPFQASPTRPGVHTAVLRALTEPNEAYFQIIDQLDRKTADINALDTNGSGQTALHIAAAAGLDSIIELLLERGAHADAIDAAGDTPLHLAAKMGKLDAVKSLLCRREGIAVINATNNEGLTPLVQAIFESLNVDVVQELLHHGADPNVSILDDGTAVHLMTVTPGFESIVREAIRCGGDLEARDTHGNTPLHLAAQYGKTSLIQYFLDQKAELANAKNIAGQTPGQIARDHGHTESAALLQDWSLRHAAFVGDTDGLLTAISSGAGQLSTPLDSASNTAVHLLAEKNHSSQLESLLSEASRPEIDAMLITTNAQGNTPLHVAAQHGNTEVVLSLAAQSSSLKEAMSVSNVDGLTPLLLAAQKGHVQVVHELLNEVPSQVMMGDEDQGNTALHFAAQEGHLPMVELLLARGADVNARNSFNQTPLHLAATWNESLVVHRLLECGADPAAVDDQGKTPLELARIQEHMELWHAMLGSQLRRAAAIGDLIAVMNALTSGALVDSKNNTSGDTALHVAAKNGQASILGTLLDHTPDPIGSLSILNDAGNAPLHVAARAGETDVIRVILSVDGVDPNMMTSEGDTALHIAAGEGWIHAVQELFKGDADLNKTSEGRGSTALHDAACNCDLAMVKTLLQLGADPNAVDSFSCNNPLHQVALWGQPDGCGAIIEALVAAGANPEARNCDGKTPAALARTTATMNNASSASESVVENGEIDLIAMEEAEEEENASDVFGRLASAPSAPPPPPPLTKSTAAATTTTAAAVASSSAWEFSMMPAATAPMASTISPSMMSQRPTPQVQSSTVASTAASTTILETIPDVPPPPVPVPVPTATTSAVTPVAVPMPSPGRPTGPVRVASEVYYPNIYATDEDPSSIPPHTPFTESVPCVPLKSVRAAAAGPAPASPFAAAVPQPEPVAVAAANGVNLAAFNPLSAPPRSRASSSLDENGGNNNSGNTSSANNLSAGAAHRRTTSSEPSNNATPNTSTSILDNRLLIPYNQLKYDIRAKLGKGSFGEVFRGTLHGNRVAIKILYQNEDEYSVIPNTTGGAAAPGAPGAIAIPTPSTAPAQTPLSQRMMEDFVREIDIMAGLRHDNIQDLRGYCITPKGPAIISKYYARGSMADALRQGLSNPERQAELTWGRILHMAVDVAAGMLYMHSYETPILHRDLKAINCFLDEHYRALVGDFGLTKPMQDRARSAASSGLGANNPRWLAPELLTDSDLGESHYTTKTDIYAFAMVMYELLTWTAPFKNTGNWEIINKIGRGERPPIPTASRLPALKNEIFVQEGVMDEYVALMKRCWAQDPGSRPEFEEIHTQLEKILERYIQSVRARRESAAGVGAGIGVENGLLGIVGGVEPGRVAVPQ